MWRSAPCHFEKGSTVELNWGGDQRKHTTHAYTYTWHWRVSGGVLTLTKVLFLALAKSKKRFSKGGKKSKEEKYTKLPLWRQRATFKGEGRPFSPKLSLTLEKNTNNSAQIFQSRTLKIVGSAEAKNKHVDCIEHIRSV